MTFKELGMQNLTFDDIKLGYVDRQIEKAWQPMFDSFVKGVSEETIATEGQTVFAVTNAYTPGTSQIMVEVDGVPQDDDSFTETDNHTVTLSEGVPAGARVVVTIGKVQPNADARFESLADAIDAKVAIPQQDTPPADAVTGTIWLDTSDNEYQGTVFEDLDGKIDNIAIEVESFRTTGLSDADTIINAIAGSVGKKLKFPFNKTYVMTKKLRIPAGDIQIDGNGSTLDFSGYTGDFAIEIIPASSNKRRLLNVLENVIIKGKNTTTTTTDGLFFGRPIDITTGVTAHFVCSNIEVDGFRDNIVIGSQSYLMTFNNLISIHHARYPINFQTITNAGENIRFFGGTISNGLLGSEGIFCDTNINPDVYFHSTSFDYSERLFLIKGGHWNFYGCHLENNNNNPMMRVIYTPGNSVININIFGGTMGNGPMIDAASPEQAGGRSHYIELTGDKINLTMIGVDTYLYDKTSSVYKITSGVPYVNIINPSLAPKGGNPPDVGDYHLLWNGDFESATAFQGWNQSAGTGTLTLDTSTFYSGTKSANFTVASGTSNGSLSQDINGAVPGKMLLFSGYFKTNLTAGYMTIRLQSLNAKGDVVNDWILDTSTGCQISSVTDWKKIGLGYSIPSGVTKFTFQIYYNGVTGTCWADKMKAWIV
jgi:hypothetical protein